MSDRDCHHEVEQWNTIPEFPAYEASTHGAIRDSVGTLLRQGHMALKGPRAPYLYVYLKDACGKSTRQSVHRLVLFAFVGPCPKGHLCAHYDGNGSNNRIENLRWATFSDNYADAERHGTAAHGERIGNSKLTAKQVRNIRDRLAQGEMLKTLASEYQVSIGHIGNLKAGRFWPSASDEARAAVGEVTPPTALPHTP